MRILLPPSEAKASGGRGRPLQLRPPHPSLAAPRAAVADALARLLAGPRSEAVRALALPPAVTDGALAANDSVLRSGTLAALSRYTGVVYDALAGAGLDAKEQALARRQIFIFSGLLGVVRGDEPVPAYRVPAHAALPGIGTLAPYWRRELERAAPRLLGLEHPDGRIDATSGLVVDLRSSDYLAMWRPRPVHGNRVLRVRIESPLPGGGWGVVSFASKHAKGRLAAALVRRTAAGLPVDRASDVAEAWANVDGPDTEAGPATAPTTAALPDRTRRTSPARAHPAHRPQPGTRPGPSEPSA